MGKAESVGQMRNSDRNLVTE